MVSVIILFKLINNLTGNPTRFWGKTKGKKMRQITNIKSILPVCIKNSNDKTLGWTVRIRLNNNEELFYKPEWSSYTSAQANAFINNNRGYYNYEEGFVSLPEGYKASATGSFSKSK